MNSFAKAIEQLGKGQSIKCAGFEAIKRDGGQVLVKSPGRPDTWVSMYSIRAELEAALDSQKSVDEPTQVLPARGRRGRNVTDEPGELD
jgi:hypothetical protein